ncbi:MAG: Lrp/AsnC family transcriptional regulator [Hyphomicrobiaceae bacterium]
MRARLDATDWRILRELQADGRITNVTLAARVGLSPPPCLRRVQALEQAGFITGYTARIDARMVGFEVTAFAMVTLRAQGEMELRDFENQLVKWPLVREAHMLAGDADFMLKCVAPDLTRFQEFVLGELTTLPNVSSVKTTVVLRTAKSEPGVPLEPGAANR